MRCMTSVTAKCCSENAKTLHANHCYKSHQTQKALVSLGQLASKHSTNARDLLQLKVSPVTPKQAKALPAGALMTSPVAQVLAGAYRKALKGQAPTLDSVAGSVAHAMTNRWVLLNTVVQYKCRGIFSFCSS